MKKVTAKKMKKVTALAVISTPDLFNVELKSTLDYLYRHDPEVEIIDIKFEVYDKKMYALIIYKETHDTLGTG